MQQTDQLAAQVLKQAEACGLTLATAESCTGGALAEALSRAPGAGKWLHGGFVTYTKDMKHAVLGVPRAVLSEKTAVCAEVAAAMAEGALARSPAQIAIAITGVAGPEPDEDGNPVGLVYCAVGRRGWPTRCERFVSGAQGREEVIADAIRHALTLARSVCV